MNLVVAKLKAIITESNNIDILFNNNLSNEKLSRIDQNFNKINNEIEPTTQNSIHEVIFEEELSILIDELINLYFKELNKGKEENIRKQCIFDYINNHKINLQEIYNWLSNNQVNSNSICLLGYFNYYGIGIDINKQKAFDLYQKAIELENDVAQLDFANMCIHVYKDYDKAFELSKKLTERKNPNAMNRLGYCYENGYGTVVDTQMAFELYQKATDLENSNGVNNLGRCYEKGIGTHINMLKAFELYKRAADLENSYGIFNLGCCYENGMGTNVNVQKAFELYQEAADLGNPFGLNNLGRCYRNGIGTDINMRKAFELFQKAANLENYFAQYNLAAMYEYGLGVEADIDQAISWYKKSAAQEYQYAQNKLRELLAE
jgi:TPR repeat protein